VTKKKFAFFMPALAVKARQIINLLKWLEWMMILVNIFEESLYTQYYTQG
jgi:hypothetical protein